MKIVDILIVNAAQILTMVNGLGVIEGGAIAILNGKIIEVGLTVNLVKKYRGKKVLDAKNKVVTPGLIECHTHLVFAGSREDEFEKLLKGKTYLQILAEGGGILKTVKVTRAASKKDLLNLALKRLKEFLKYGVTVVEIKSGYGLDYENEKKILEIINELKGKSKQKIVPTFLGAHVFPKEINEDDYLKELGKMLKDFKILAEFCDIFIEKGAFSCLQAEQILSKAKSLGYKIKLHTNQINSLGGIELAKKYGAISLDHLDNLSDKEIEILSKTKAVAVLNPGASFFTKGHYADARKLLARKIKVAISTDFNPGTSPSNNLHFMMSLAVNNLKILPEEVWQSVTINAAKALAVEDKFGSIEKDKNAHIVIWNMPNHLYPFYYFGKNFVERVIL